MRKISIGILSLLSVVLLTITGCLKGDEINADPDAAKTIVTLEYLAGGSGTTIGSGLSFFGGAALTYPPTDESDTATYSVILAGGAALNEDVTVTIGADANAVLDNFGSDSINYEIMPDSLYHLMSNTATIKAGQTSAVFQVVFYPSKVDASKNFMLPLTVTEAGGYTVSSNYGHIYFHTIGNPLAGSYLWDYTRYNTGDTTSAVITAWEGEATTFLPDNPTTVEVQSGYGDQNGFNVRYMISFDNDNGVLSNPVVKINPNDVTDNLTPNVITLVTPATILLADLENMHFRFMFRVTNSAGAFRTVVDEFYK